MHPGCDRRELAWNIGVSLQSWGSSIIAGVYPVVLTLASNMQPHEFMVHDQFINITIDMVILGLIWA